MEVPLPRLQIGPCLKCKGLSESKEKHHKQKNEVKRPTLLSFKFLKVISQVTCLYSIIIYIRNSSTKLGLWDKVHDDYVILLYMDMCLIT